MHGRVASLLSLSEPECLISGQLYGRILQGPRSTTATDTRTQYSVLGFFFIVFVAVHSRLTEMIRS